MAGCQMRSRTVLAWVLLSLVSVAGMGVTFTSAVIAAPLEVKQFSFADEVQEAFVIAVKSKAKAEKLSEDDLATLDASPDTSVVMTAHDGQKYLCRMPPAAAEVDSDDVGGSTDVDSAAAASRAPGRDGSAVSELLEPLANACFYRIEGWWTYEFCHKRKVRQYHQEEKSTTNEYNLGEYDAGATAALHDARGHFTEAPGGPTGSTERYHAHVFTGGTACDLTELERQTEVRFVCAPTAGINAITAIKEPATCKYTFTFATPMLCDHHSFKVQEKPVSHIRCKAFTEKEKEEEGSGG
eukprot:CAMPEP_0181363218 /NCGR_PEP_ID=MMETSP1106-20121128/8570_1 /TAXON_ID=81844 /ORGANISM="Mantoniella antarctica, Strain SL-175" /LENGTH=296 /DNA_ID=CAMNT_0023477519 /DNA_START=256 /DNA_END=1142 /DNA_ORIENTATION=+